VYFSNNAFALTCERTTNDSRGYKNKQAFESWWPKNFDFNADDFEEAGGGSKAMFYVRNPCVQHEVYFG
jgi:hypothetical protein